MAVTGASSFLYHGNAPENIPLPTVGPEPDALPFDMAARRSGVPGIVNPGNTLARHRDWQANWRHPRQGFAGVRWCPSWVDTRTRPGAWEPATGDVWRIYRKGTEGTSAQTLVFECSANPATIPTGEPVVLWQSDGADSVLAATTMDLSGYALPLKQKLVVSGGAGSAPEDAAGFRLVEVFTGQALPAINMTPATVAAPYGTKSTVQLRHWAFYKNTTTKELRQPIKQFADTSINKVLHFGGHVMLGGNEFLSATNDWSLEYINFGATLTEELYRLECEGLAHHFGSTDVRKLAVELENRVLRPWENVDTVPGYRYLLSNVFYPIAREAWGNERTLVVKPANGMAGLELDFDWRCPAGHMVQIGIHETSATTDFATLAGTDALAASLTDIIGELGYTGGGLVTATVVPPVTMEAKGLALGNVLTSLSTRKLYTFFNGHVVGANPLSTINVADLNIIDGFQIESLFHELRQRASRAGLVV